MALILLPTAVEPPDAMAWPPRPALVAWTLMALISAHFFISHLVAWDHLRHWGLVSDSAFRGITYVTTAWTLYADPALFAPWQLWTYALIHDHWAGLLANLLVLLVIGRAVERWIGPAAFLGAVVTLMPLAAVIHLLADHEDGVLTGANGLVVGVVGMAWALFPRSRVRWGLAYFAIIVLGYLPLFRLALPWIAALYVVADIALHAQTTLIPTAACDLSALAAGVVLGIAGRRMHRQEPDV